MICLACISFLNGDEEGVNGERGDGKGEKMGGEEGRDTSWYVK